MHRSWARAAAVAVVAAISIGSGATGAGALEDPPGGHNVGDRASGATNGNTVVGNAGTGDDHNAPAPPGADDGSNGPNCTMSDGTPGYLHYQGLQYTTMEEQRTEIRPEEQRPGVYLHIYCNDEYLDFAFFPDNEPRVDPRQLASTVVLPVPSPQIMTSPAPGDHLVGMEAWFWLQTGIWQPLEDSTGAGGVRVTVRAVPSALTIDPGDGSGTFTCEDPPAYTPGGTSSCTHVYQRAGNYVATATLTFQTSFTSNIGVRGNLAPIETTSTTNLAVSEAQAINT
jgi:hypothetical protein